MLPGQDGGRKRRESERLGLGFRIPWGGLEQATPKDRRGSGDSTRGAAEPRNRVIGHPGEGLSTPLPNPLLVEVATPQAARHARTFGDGIPFVRPRCHTVCRS